MSFLQVFFVLCHRKIFKCLFFHPNKSEKLHMHIAHKHTKIDRKRHTHIAAVFIRVWWKRETRARKKKKYSHSHFTYTHVYIDTHEYAHVFAIKLWTALLLTRKIFPSRGRRPKKKQTNDLALWMWEKKKSGNGTLQRVKTHRKWINNTGDGKKDNGRHTTSVK